MDSQGEEVTTWFGNLCENLRALSSVVDDIRFEESFKYVEEHVLAAGENVKQFCSDVIKDVLAPDMVDSMKAHDLVLEQEKNTDLTSPKGSNTDVGVDHEKGILCDINASSHASLVESVEENHIDSSLKEANDIGVHEESNVDFKADISSAQLSANSVNFSKSSEIKCPDKEGTSSGNSLSAVSSGISKKAKAEKGDLLRELRDKRRQKYLSMMKSYEKQKHDGLASCSKDVDPESSQENSKSSFLSLDDDWEII